MGHLNIYLLWDQRRASWLRSLVNPQVKDEGHALNKVFRHEKRNGSIVFEKDADGNYVRQDHPRWRLILIQGVVDHVVGVVLHKNYTEASVGLFQMMPDQELFWHVFYLHEWVDFYGKCR